MKKRIAIIDKGLSNKYPSSAEIVGEENIYGEIHYDIQVKIPNEGIVFTSTIPKTQVIRVIEI